MTDTQPQRLPPPDGPSWLDFEPLLPAELILLRAAARGDIAKVGYRRPRSPTPDVRLRAEFLALLASGGGHGAPVVGRNLQVMGACIVGRFDLSAATLPMSLWLYRCTFGAPPVFDGAHVRGSLTFSDCALPGLRAEGARIDGDLAISAGCSVDGEVRLARSAVGGDLNCERLRVRGPSPAPGSPLRRMFVADGMRIGGDVNLRGGVEAVGEVRFIGARIGGSLHAGAAHLTADIDAAGMRGVALNLDRVRIGGSLLLDAGFAAAGTVRLKQVRIRGDLDCSGAAFDAVGDANWGECGSALMLDRARIDGALILHRLQAPLQGASLFDARVGTLSDDAGSWGGQHVLDGFTYKRFGPNAPTDAPMRLDWLLRQDAAHVDTDCRPDPWRRAIRVLRRMGHGPSATRVAIGQAQHLRRIGHVGSGMPPGLCWLARLGHRAWGICSGYGHRPLRLVVSGAVVWLLCAAAYWAAAEHGGFALAADGSAAGARLGACRPPSDCAVQLPGGVPNFQPLVYSLDALLPLADLSQERHWAPARNALMPEFELRTGVPPLQLLVWLEAACGWLVAFTGLASFLRLQDR